MEADEWLEVRKRGFDIPYLKDNAELIEELLDESRYININYMYYDEEGEECYYTSEDDVVTQYCRDVLRGKYMVGILEIQACMSHLEDLQRERYKGKYVFDVDYALRIIKMSESKLDRKSGRGFRLAPSQRFIEGFLLGWREDVVGVDVDGNEYYKYKKRIDDAFINMGRQNGKTDVVSDVATYELMEGEIPFKNRLITSAATQKSQANIIKDYCRESILNLIDVGYKDYVNKYEEKFYSLWNIEDGSEFRAVASERGEGGNLHGKGGCLNIFDECHAYPNDTTYESLVTSTGQQDDYLNIIISTVGKVQNGFFYKKYQEAVRTVQGEDNDGDTTFVYIAAQDSMEEVENPMYWAKSNPLLNHENEDIVRRAFNNLKKQFNKLYKKGNENSFKIYHMNMWSDGSSDSLVSLSDWDSCIIEDKEFNRNGRQCYIGIDLGLNHDLTAVTFTYPTIKDRSEVEVVVESKGFIPNPDKIEMREEKDGFPYREYVNKGYAEFSHSISGQMDEEQVVNYILNKVRNHDLKVINIFFDPALSSKFKSVLEVKAPALYSKMVSTSQKKEFYNPVIWAFKHDLTEGRVKVVRNDLLRVSVMNTEITSDKGLYRPIKVNGLTNDNACSMLMTWHGVIGHVDVADALLREYYTKVFKF